MSIVKKFKSKIGNRSPIRLGWHFSKSFLAALINGFPARKLNVIGVTGTDGKTTTVGMISHILNFVGIKTGAASTAFMQIGDDKKENETHLTSIKPITLQSFLKKLVKEKCTHAVIEVSSHGLVQGRVHHTYPKVATVTNTSPEHLDYHGTMDQYRKDKGKIFEMLKGKGAKILNQADESFEMYDPIPSEKSITFGTEDSDLWITEAKSSPTCSQATLKYRSSQLSIVNCQLSIPIPGLFNLDNAMCAIGCAISVGIPLDECLEALESFTALPGRMERIDEGQNFNVFVDFTMTEEAYKRTLETVRKMTEPGKRVIVVFGCCGNRMKNKRPRIAKIVSELSDVAFVAGDETYGEDPDKVVDEVWDGIDRTKVEAFKYYDRREAIKQALMSAKFGDTVICCGMGPFGTFNTLKGPIPWDERKVVRELLNEHN